MKKAIVFFYVLILLQSSSIAQVIEMDTLFFQNLNNELLVPSDEIVLDLDFEKEIKNELPKLQAILNFILENKYHSIEISSHTSCVGNLITNLKTTEARAEKLKNELYSLADSSEFTLLKKNLTVVGKGEFNPLIKCECAHCSELSHQQNDRIMIKLVRVIHSPPTNSSNYNPSKPLAGRGGRGPSFDPASEVEGKITIRVCVDQEGYVLTSQTEYVPEQSTIEDEKIIAQAIRAANRWKFKPADIEIACGTVTYVIKIK